MPINIQRSSVIMNQAKEIIERKVKDIIIFQKLYPIATQVLPVGRDRIMYENKVKCEIILVKEEIEILEIQKHRNQLNNSTYKETIFQRKTGYDIWKWKIQNDKKENY